jgi:hypothetical protein
VAGPLSFLLDHSSPQERAVGEGEAEGAAVGEATGEGRGSVGQGGAVGRWRRQSWAGRGWGGAGVARLGGGGGGAGWGRGTAAGAAEWGAVGRRCGTLFCVVFGQRRGVVFF